MNRRALPLALLVAASVTGCGGSSTADRATTVIGAGTSVAASSAATTAAPSAASLGDLPSRWWEWVGEAPSGRSPISDATGADCANDQPSDVFFLAGTSGGTAERTCAVPSGRPVYFPVLNTVCAVTAGQTVAAADAACAFGVDSQKVTLDGRELAAAEAASTSEFLYQGAQSVAYGVWVGPVTIPSGTHELAFSGSSGTFSLSVTYHLTVA